MAPAPTDEEMTDVSSKQEKEQDKGKEKEESDDEMEVEGEEEEDNELEFQGAEIPEKEKARWEALKNERASRLDYLKKKIDSVNNDTTEVEGEEGGKLNQLLQQIELYSHFMTGRGAANADDSKESGNGNQKKGTKRGRKTEKEEDEVLLKGEQGDDIAPVRLTASPYYIAGGTMRPYQVHGLNWMIKLYDNGISGILADEMGLGKTLQSISLLGYLKHMRGIPGPHLVIAPKSTLANWVKEVAKWCPTLKTLKLLGSKDERAEQRQQLAKGDYNVVVTSFEIAIIEKNALKRVPWYYLVIDEAHRIKNEKSVLSSVVRLFSTQCRLLLTGTPLQNNLHELWALLNFLLPEVFGSADDFDKWFDIKGSDPGEVVQKLHKILRPFLLRRLKSDVEKDLPPKKETRLFVGLSQMQKEWYKKILRKDLAVIGSSEDGSKSKGNRVRLLNIVMQLRKCCNHPYLFQGAEPGPPYTNGPHLVENSGKMIVLDKLLPKLQEQGSRVLIFSQMTRLLDILEDYLVFRGFQYCRIDGSTAGDVREEMIEAYNKPNSEKFVFLLSTRAGGLGINLATADIVILYDSDWNPQCDLQAQDRAHRIGQKKPVKVFRFVTETTVEEKVVERAMAKLQLDNMVIQQGRLVDQNKALSSNELLNMLKHGAEEIISSSVTVSTDTDIDEILKRGEAKTQEANDEIQKRLKEMGADMRGFALDGGEESTFNVHNFDGVNYQEEKKNLKDILITNWEDGPRTRIQRVAYNVDEYYRGVMKSDSKQKKTPLPRPPKQPVIYDFQFYPEKLYQLFEKETSAYRSKIEARKAGNYDEEADYGELTEEEEASKDKMLQLGFSNWSRKDFMQFIKACERHGRKDIANITLEMEGKTEKEIRAYMKAFKQNYKKVNGWERLIDRIERGEDKILRVVEMQNALAEKVARYKDPFKQLKISYGNTKGKAYTAEEDAFLLCMTHQLGYGNWDELKAEIRKSWQFRFDWYLKSRTPQELNRRVDILMRIIQKENEELRSKKGGSGSKRKATQSPASTQRKRKKT